MLFHFRYLLSPPLSSFRHATYCLRYYFFSYADDYCFSHYYFIMIFFFHYAYAFADAATLRYLLSFSIITISPGHCRYYADILRFFFISPSPYYYFSPPLRHIFIFDATCHFFDARCFAADDIAFRLPYILPLRQVIIVLMPLRFRFRHFLRFALFSPHY